MAMPSLPVDVESAGEFDFLRAVPRYADRDRTQQAVTADGRLRWRVEVLFTPRDERASSETMRIGYSGPRPAIDRGAQVTPVGLTVGEFNGAVYLTAQDFQPVQDDVSGVPPFGVQED